VTRELRARAVWAEMDALGVTLDDLVAIGAAGGTLAPGSVQGPSVREYLDTVFASYGARTADTYKAYWKLLVARCGDMPVAAVRFDDCAAVVDAAAARATRNRGSDGRSARESCVGALRAFFERAKRSGLVVTNPATDLQKPRRLPSRRRALTDSEFQAVLGAVAETSRDPDLDFTLIRFHLESGARLGGAVALRLRDVDDARSTVWLHEKFSATREQPVSPSMIEVLRTFAASRGRPIRTTRFSGPGCGAPARTSH
jgi:integrase/recombinase XerC